LIILHASVKLGFWCYQSNRIWITVGALAVAACKHNPLGFQTRPVLGPHYLQTACKHIFRLTLAANMNQAAWFAKLNQD
jgi:hypothetical protein